VAGGGLDKISLDFTLNSSQNPLRHSGMSKWPSGEL
jgi:hypothetical protein